jgi:valyl-tRNA synthetase
MASAYHPEVVERGWDAWWTARGFYKPAPKNESNDNDDTPFVMLLPPPNVTGTLHLGHALTIAIEDALVRFHRMRGKRVLWLPGTDHAGIATQVGGTCAARACKLAGPFPPFTPQVIISAARAALKSKGRRRGQ